MSEYNNSDNMCPECHAQIDENTSCTCKNKNGIPFWAEDLNVLLKPEYLLEFFPTDNMCYQQKMNAISRLVVVLTIIGFIFTRSFRLVIVSAITLLSIFLLYNFQTKDKSSQCKSGSSATTPEGFSGPAKAAFEVPNKPIPTDVFVEPTATNPFSNVLMTDYEDNVNKKPAPPSYISTTNNSIFQNAKQLVIDTNKDNTDVADKLFRDLGENMVFEQSLRQFVSNPATTIPNDQQAFAEFCYGSMISAKEGNMFALARNMSRTTGN